jgi:hypothetical protein
MITTDVLPMFARTDSNGYRYAKLTSKAESVGFDVSHVIGKHHMIVNADKVEVNFDGHGWQIFRRHELLCASIDVTAYHPGRIQVQRSEQYEIGMLFEATLYENAYGRIWPHLEERHGNGGMRLETFDRVESDFWIFDKMDWTVA